MVTDLCVMIFIWKLYSNFYCHLLLFLHLFTWFNFFCFLIINCDQMMHPRSWFLYLPVKTSYQGHSLWNDSFVYGNDCFCGYLCELTISSYKFTCSMHFCLCKREGSRQNRNVTERCVWFAVIEEIPAALIKIICPCSPSCCNINELNTFLSFMPWNITESASFWMS